LPRAVADAAARYYCAAMLSPCLLMRYASRASARSMAPLMLFTPRHDDIADICCCCPP